jgi:pyrroline-5-carboxylate reductase
LAASAAAAAFFFFFFSDFSTTTGAAAGSVGMGATQAAEQAVPGFGFSNEAFSKHIQTLQGSVSSGITSAWILAETIRAKFFSTLSESVLETRRNTWSCLA